MNESQIIFALGVNENLGLHRHAESAPLDPVWLPHRNTAGVWREGAVLGGGAGVGRGNLSGGVIITANQYKFTPSYG